MKLYPYEKWGLGKFSHADGAENGFEVVLTRELEVLSILMEGGEGVCERFLPCLDVCV